MKLDQIDNALQFIDEFMPTIVLQIEYESDRKLIVDHLRDAYGVRQITQDLFDIGADGGLGEVYILTTDKELGFRNEQLFLIERPSDEYIEGDIIGKTMGGKPINYTPRVGGIYTATSKTTSTAIRRHDAVEKLMVIHEESCSSNDPDMQRTMVIQFKHESMRQMVRAMVQTYKHKNAESWIDDWRSIDVFVDLSLNHPTGASWLRVVYECLEDNPNPGQKFHGAYRLVIEKSFNTEGKTLDTLLRGVK